MPTRTNIEWTDFTSNPIQFKTHAGARVWGCVKTSPGCAHCYAESLAHRFDRGGPFTASTMEGLTPRLDEAEVWALLRSKPIAGKRLFLADMTDLFGAWVPDAILDRLLVVMAYRHDVTFQVLTKRADRMREYFAGVGADTDEWRARWDAARKWVRALFTMPTRPHEHNRELIGVKMAHTTFPLPNVHAGVSVEDNARASLRLPALTQTKAAVRFVSMEPLLESVDISIWMYSGFEEPPFDDVIDWVIVGGESGPGARRCDVAWIRSIVQQCQAASVPVFVKQLGARRIITGSAEDRMREYDRGYRANNWTNHKGADPSEWPKDLRVREFPSEARS